MERCPRIKTAVTFAMVVDRTPKSLQATHKERYMAHLAQEAAVYHRGRPTLTGALYARIVWVHPLRTGPDADNIAKPILDSLKGIVFEDDDLIVQCYIEKIFNGPGASPTILARNQPPTEVYAKLVSLVYKEKPHKSDVLYVEIGQVEAQQITFGPINGDEP